MLLHYLGKQDTQKLRLFTYMVHACLPKKQNKNITWSELNHPSLSKRSTTQDLGREHSILLSVTHMLYINQVCHGVGHCVKDGSCSSSSLSESHWTVLVGYLTISANADAIKHITDDNFSFRKTTHCMQHSPTAAALSTNTTFE